MSRSIIAAVAAAAAVSVRYAHIFESPTDVTVVMEYFNGGDLFQWVRVAAVYCYIRRGGWLAAWLAEAKARVTGNPKPYAHPPHLKLLIKFATQAQTGATCPGGEEFMAYVAEKLAQALELLHENNIAHGDVK